MNWKTTFHLVRTELHRNLWIIVALLGVALFVPDLFLGGLVAGLLVARIAQGDHLTRPTAHWKSRPVSMSSWAVSRVLLLFFLILLPVTIQQGWNFHDRGFDYGATSWAMIEVAMITAVFVSVIFALATAASNWVPLAFLLAAVFTYGAVVGMIVADGLEFSAGEPHGMRSFYTTASFQPRPSVWWVFWLGSVGMSLLVIIIHWSLRRRVLTHLFLGVGVAAFIVGAMWAESTSHRVVIQSAPEEASLKEFPKAGNPGTHQKVYQSIGIQGLAEGQFVEVKTIRAKGEKDHYENRLKQPRDKAEIEDRFQGKKALVRLLPGSHRILSLHESFSDLVSANLKLKIFDTFQDPSINHVGLGGEVFQWVELGTVPIAANSTSLKNDLFCKVVRGPAVPEGTGVQSYRLILRQPTLTLSPNPTENAITSGWQGVSRIAVVASHEDLKETLILSVQVGSFGTSDTSFGLDKSVDIDVKILENPNWKILWPEGNPTEQWIEGAEFRIYGQEYLGQLEAELDLMR